MNAALEAGQDALASMPNEILNADQKFQALSATLDDASKKLGEAFLPVAELLSDVFIAFSNNLNVKKIQVFATVVTGTLVVAMYTYRAALIEVIKKQTMLGWGAMATAAGFLAVQILELTGVFNGVPQAVDDANTSTGAYMKNLISMKKEEIAAELEAQRAKLVELTGTTEVATESQDKQNKSLKDYVSAGHDFDAIVTNRITEVNDATLVLNENTERLNDNTIATFEKTEQDKVDEEQTQKRIEVLNEYNLALEKGEKECVFLNEKYNIMTASNIIILVENTPRMMAFQLQ